MIFKDTLFIHCNQGLHCLWIRSNLCFQGGSKEVKMVATAVRPKPWIPFYMCERGRVRLWSCSQGQHLDFCYISECSIGQSLYHKEPDITWSKIGSGHISKKKWLVSLCLDVGSLLSQGLVSWEDMKLCFSKTKSFSTQTPHTQGSLKRPLEILKHKQNEWIGVGGDM